jgi:hypothetical protein
VCEPRSDTVADWYTNWVADGDGLIALAVGDLVPTAVRGARVLDSPAGTPGHHGRSPDRGCCHRVDLSPDHRRTARAAEESEPLGIRITRPTSQT